MPFLWRHRSPEGQGLLILQVSRSHTAKHHTEELATCLNIFNVVTLIVGYLLCAFIVRTWLLCLNIVSKMKDLEIEQIVLL